MVATQSVTQPFGNTEIYLYKWSRQSSLTYLCQDYMHICLKSEEARKMEKWKHLDLLRWGVFGRISVLKSSYVCRISNFKKSMILKIGCWVEPFAVYSQKTFSNLLILRTVGGLMRKARKLIMVHVGSMAVETRQSFSCGASDPTALRFGSVPRAWCCSCWRSVLEWRMVVSPIPAIPKGEVTQLWGQSPVRHGTIVSPRGIIQSAWRFPGDHFERDMILWVQKLWVVEDMALSWRHSQALLCPGQDLEASASALKASLLTGAWHGTAELNVPSGHRWTCTCVWGSSATTSPLTNHLAHLHQAVGFAWVLRKAPNASLNNNEDCQAPFWHFRFPKCLAISDLIISSLQPFEL